MSDVDAMNKREPFIVGTHNPNFN